MKTYFSKHTFTAAAAVLLLAAFESSAQNRGGGGGGGGFGGFGGFGGGGFGGANRSSSSSSTAQYNNNGTVGSATFSVDPDTHNIVVIADEETAKQISEVINNLDAPKRQVLIKVVFLEVQHNNSLDVGLEGGWTGPVGNNSVSAANAFGLNSLNSIATNFNALGQPFTTPFPLSSAGSGGFYQIVGKDFQVTMQAIAQAGKAEILSRPSILARDGQLAEIVAGQSIYLPSGVTYGTAGSTGTVIPTINGSYQNVGIQLDVTPFIGANNMVEMIVQPQDTSIDTSTPGQVISGGSVLSSAIYAPNINKQSANTVVITPDAQTVVIGGLISNAKSDSDSKIPLLGDIPFLGNLFKHQSKSNQKQELVIFLTPHIVQAPMQLSEMSRHESGQANLFVTNSFSEQQLDQFLDRVPTKKSK